MLTLTIAIILSILVIGIGLTSIWADDYQRENIKRELDHKYGRN